MSNKCVTCGTFENLVSYHGRPVCEECRDRDALPEMLGEDGIEVWRPEEEGDPQPLTLMEGLGLSRRRA